MPAATHSDCPVRRSSVAFRGSLQAVCLALAVALSTPACADDVLVALAGDTVQVIANADRAPLKLDRPVLQAIFLMRVREWPDGTPVRVFVMPTDSELHDRFARELLGTYPYVLNRTWDRMVFTGTGLAPAVVRSEQEMRDKVSKTPGAIGYRLTTPKSQTDSTRFAGG
jgi:ABC-type phosphate transport system substrate-binding protein